MEGTPVKIGKQEFIVPEATLEVAEQVLPVLRSLGDAKNDAEVFTTIAGVVRLCLAENYPALSEKDVKRAMPLRRSLDIMNEVLEAAGFERPKPTDGAAPGEAARP